MYECTQLKSVTLPKNLRSIEPCTFYKCRSLTSLVIPEGIKSIGYSAFYGCPSITAIKIPEGVTSIGTEAFRDCSSLASIVIPETVTSIVDYAFSNCSSLTSITLPCSIKKINDGAFSSCSSLTSIVIPEAVTSIGDCAFNGCSSLTAITIPEGVTSIGYAAFSGCSSLTAITIQEGVTSICNSAFAECSSLKSVVIPEGVTSIGSYAFSSCSSLTSVFIPSGIKFLNNDYSPFYECYNIKRFVCPNNFTFENSEPSWFSRSKLTYDPDNSVFENGVLYDAAKTSIIFVSDLNKGNFVIPETVKTIGKAAFLNCSGVESVSIPNSVESIGESAFYGCTGLKSLVFPNSVKEFGASVIAGCSNLESVEFGEGISVLGQLNLNNDSFKKLTVRNPYPPTLGSLSIPATAMIDVPVEYFPRYYAAPVWKNYFNQYTVNRPYNLTAPSGEGVIPTDNLTATKLTITDLTNGRKYQANAYKLDADSTFMHITNFELLATATRAENSDKKFFIPAQLTITNKVPEGVETTGNDASAMWVCESIPEEKGDYKYYTIPVTGVNLADEFVADYNQIYIEDSENPLYLYQNLPTRFKKDMGSSCALTLYLGRDVVNKGESAALFGLGAATTSESYPLTAVTLGPKLRNIYDNTFAYANDLMDITFAGDDCLQTIGSRAFEGLRWSKPITFPKGLKTIGNYAFTENRYLNTINFSEAPELTIYEGAFQYCQRLANVNYASRINKISKYAFRYCESYNGVIDIKSTTIEESAFERCQFTKLTLNTGLIGKNVFRNISTLTSLSGVMDCIGEGAFAGCADLETINITGDVAVCSNAFGPLQKLKSVSLDIKEIQSNAFYSASEGKYPVIGTLTFGNNVTTIGDNAFYGLNRGNSTACQITFGNGLKSIGASAFAYSFFDKVHFATVEEANPVMTIASGAFNQITLKNSTLPAIALGNTVKSVGANNFYQITLKKGVAAEDVVADLGSTVTSFGDNCFTFQNAKSTITIPGSVTYLGSGFTNFHKIIVAPGAQPLEISMEQPDYYGNYYGNPSLTADYIEINKDCVGPPKEWHNMDGQYGTYHEPFNNNTTTLWAAKQMSIGVDPNSTFSGRDMGKLASQKLIVGPYCKSYPVTLECQNVEIQEGVENINTLNMLSYASQYNWYDMPGSRRIVLPASLNNINTFSIANSVEDALIISDGDKPLTFGTAPKTGNMLTEIYVGRNTSLSNPSNGGAFQGFPNLEKCVIGPKVTEITPAMFKDCPMLTNIIFGREDVAEGVDAIAEMKLKKISANAFQNCRGLQVLSLPETLETAGADAFHGFQGLQRIVARGATPALGTVAWGTAIEDVVEFYYPAASEDKYRASDMFYPFFNAGHAFTNEGNIADEVRIPITDDEVEDLDEVAAGSSYTLPAAVAFTTPVETESAPKMGKRAKALANRRVISAENAIMPLSNGQEVNTSFYWFAPRPDIASVDKTGKVTVHKNEPAEIWVYALDGSDRKAVIGINQPVTPGDLTRDNKLDSTDMLTLMLRIANEGRCSKISDVNADGELSASDVLQLMINIANKE